MAKNVVVKLPPEQVKRALEIQRGLQASAGASSDRRISRESAANPESQIHRQPPSQRERGEDVLALPLPPSEGPRLQEREVRPRPT